jgi:hypothetical protein
VDDAVTVQGRVFSPDVSAHREIFTDVRVDSPYVAPRWYIHAELVPPLLLL